MGTKGLRASTENDSKKILGKLTARDRRSRSCSSSLSVKFAASKREQQVPGALEAVRDQQVYFISYSHRWHSRSNRVMSPNKSSWEVEVSEKTGRPVRWSGQNWPYYRRLMELAFHKEDVFRVATGALVRDPNWDQRQVAAWEDNQRTVQRVIFASVNTDFGQQLMQHTDGTSMWAYLCNRFDGTVNDQTRALTKRRLYAELEAARCKPNSDIEGHLNSMIRLRTRLQAVGMALDDTVFSGMLVSSLPAGDRFDRLRGLVESGLDCVDTPEKIVEMAITYDKANKADQLLSRALGSNDRSATPAQQNKPRNGGGGNVGPRRPGNTRREESQRQRDEDRRTGNSFGCHKPGHARRDCPNEASGGGGQANLSYTGHANAAADKQAAARSGDTGGTATGSEKQGDPSVRAEGSTRDDGGAAGMRCHASTSTAKQQGGYQPESWVYDTGANRDLVGDKRYFVEFRKLSAAERKRETVKGYNGTTAPVGVGTIDLWVVVNGGHVAVRLEGVYFSPGRPNLFSQSEARKQGFKVQYDDAKGLYTLSKNLATALQAPLSPCGLWMFTAHNEFLPGERNPLVPEAMVNYALRDGVADLQCWHERLGHLCHQHVRKMVDNDLVDGMMLRKRQFATCEACQLGKQRAKTPQKVLDRGVTERNQLAFADLLFPPKNYNCTRFNAVLVVMDAYTRFVTVYPVKTKHKDDVNPLIKRYIVWAERQCTGCKVKTMFTDGGGEFVNDEIAAWYQANGITHTATPKNSSRLNMVERTHQTLTGMMKSMMKESGLPTSFWVDALHYAAYLKNRSYSSPIDRTPYQAMWGRKPDIHHVRKFGALAYVHTKVGPARHKFADNCQVGFVLGYREDTLGCKVYFPTAGTVAFGGQVTVNEQVMYKDRKGPEFDESVRDWAVEQYPDLTSAGRRDYDLPALGGRGDDRRAAGDDVPEDGEESVEDELQHTSEHPHASWMDREPPQFNDDIVFSSSEPPFSREDDHRSRNTHLGPPAESASGDADDSHDVEDVLVADDGLQSSNGDDRAVDQSAQHEPEYEHDDEQCESVIGDGDEQDDLLPEGLEVQSTIGEEGLDRGAEGVEFPVDPPQITGQRRGRDDEASVISGEAEPKRTRTGLVYVADGDAEDGDDEDLMREFAVYAAIAFVTMKQEPPQQRLWHESEVRLPRGVNQAMRSPQRREWWAGMEKEMAAMEAKDVLELVPEDEMPAGKRALETMWRFQFKTDNEGNVIRFRPRLCARGDKQEPEVDFFSMEIFSPVARMASFRLFVALCILLGLDLFQCDVDTAFLNAALKIIHYIRRIPGFPLKKGWVYKVKHALYGLHQSGREWYDELNSWLEAHGWSRCVSEPCLYVYSKGGVLALLLVYVDDLICGTNNEAWKVSFFAELNTKYGVKDQGRLHSYLGVQVDLTDEGAFLHQTKYAKDVLRRFGFEGARGCRSPLDPTTKLRAVADVDKEPGIDYRAAIGSLMYMATGTRPDLAFPVGYLSRFVENPTVQHGGALKRVLRYLVATADHGIFFKRPKAGSTSKLDAITIEGYCDSDWGNCPETRKSVTGYAMLVASGPVAWAARRQTVVAQSTAEAEYVASCEACMEGRALANVLTEVLPKTRIDFTLGVDNQAAITLASNPTYSRKTRHIELRFHYVRQQVAQKAVSIWKVDGDINPADLFTKPLGFPRLTKMKQLVGMRPESEPTPRENCTMMGSSVASNRRARTWGRASSEARKLSTRREAC